MKESGRTKNKQTALTPRVSPRFWLAQVLIFYKGGIQMKKFLKIAAVILDIPLLYVLMARKQNQQKTALCQRVLFWSNQTAGNASAFPF